MTYKKLKILLAALQRVIAYKFTREESLDILNVGEDILGNPEALKSAYRKAALKNHPDRGGDPEMMKKVNVAYDTLLKEEPITEEDADESVVDSIITDLRKEQKLTPSIKKEFKDEFGMEPVGYAPKAEFLRLSQHKSLEEFALYWGLEEIVDILSTISLDITEDNFIYIVSKMLEILEWKHKSLFSKIVDEMISFSREGDNLARFYKEEGYYVEPSKNKDSVVDWESFKDDHEYPYKDMANFIYWQKGKWFKSFNESLKKTLETQLPAFTKEIVDIIVDDDSLLYLVADVVKAKGIYVVGFYLDEMSDLLYDLDDDLKTVISDHFKARFSHLDKEEFVEDTLAREAIKHLVQ